MCGQLGILMGRSSRPRKNMAEIGKLFTRLLVLSEHRGPHASGAAWLDASGVHRLHKAPQPASRFVTGQDYGEWLASIPPTATLLMGHTRWPTQGSHLDNRNNHPLSDGGGKDVILLTHNGNIPQVERCFRHFGLVRRWGVDSELLLRLARRHARPNERLDVAGLLGDMGRCPGDIAAVVAWTACPDTVLLVRRERPLFLSWNARRRLLAYASKRRILEDAIHDGSGAPISSLSGWRMEAMDEGTARVFNIQTLPECVEYGFE
jgi:glucosamine 6-phosphate synthetase-like amidotransferase/phosphosugar isomerase protein